MIKINLVREGRAVRGAGAAPAAVSAVTAAAGGPTNLNGLIIIVLLGISLVLAAGWWFITDRTRARRREEVATRTAEAAKLESIIKEVEDFQKRKESLENRIKLINDLKQAQKGPVRIMDQISRDLPDLVWLDKMTVAGQHISLWGRSLNPNAIANYVENVKNDPYFEEPDLGTVTEVPGKTTVYTWDMNFNFTYQPKTPGQPGAPGGATGTSGTTTATGTAKPTTTGTTR